MLLKDISISPMELKGVGHSFLEALQKLGVNTIGDLLQLYPRTWEDRTSFNSLGEYNIKEKIRVKATVLSHSWFGMGSKRTLKITIEDDLSNKAQLICFNRPFLQSLFPIKSQVIVTGTFYKYRNELSSSSFELEKERDAISGIIPIYPLVEGLSQKKLSSIIKQAMNIYINDIESDIPKSILDKKGFLKKKDVLRCMHAPTSIKELDLARQTLVFEELFLFQLASIKRYMKRRKILPNIKPAPQKNVSHSSFSSLQQNLIKRLKFNLTKDQIKSVLEINYDLQSQLPSARLLQGDVGSGKTLVAFLASIYAVEQKWQVAFLAPTELLALQHAEKAVSLMAPLGVNIAFLSGNVKARGRAKLLQELKMGNIDIIIGTHAIFSKDVEYKNLKLAIIDEQHKFGVMQREALLKKGAIDDKEEGKVEILPHLIMMSATPIPRSLALSIFGDVDVSLIKTMPSSRKKIKTYLAQSEKYERVYGFVKEELKKSHQAYFIYPLIEASEELSFKAVEDMEKTLSSYFNEYTVKAITSKTDDGAQKEIMKDFINGNIHILVATSIVEVGVDVPNATCIVIEDAQNFPLVTLHQMRGRVGRGAEQSYCILLYKKHLTKNAYQRLKIIRDSLDGFVIAEEDLRIRGPGNVMGLEQSGYLGFHFADPIKDYNVMLEAREEAILYMKEKIKDNSN